MRAEALKGHLEGMLLAVLESGPQHGAAVVEELRRRSDGEVVLASGTIYPALHRLVTAGLVEGRDTVIRGRNRQTYVLTNAGRRALRDSREEWQQIARVMGKVLEA